MESNSATTSRLTNLDYNNQQVKEATATLCPSQAW